MTKRRIVRSILSVFLSLVLIISGFLPGMPFVSTAYAESTTKTITPGTDDAKTGKGTMEISLTIKKTPSAGDFTFTPPTSPMYDGQAKAATVTTEAEGMGEVTVEYYNGDTKLSGAPTAEGTYTVKVNVAEGDDYKAATGITDDDWTFTILPMQQTMTITLEIASASVKTAPTAKNLTYNGSEQELVTAGTTTDGTVYYALGSDASTAPADNLYDIVIPKGINAGTYYVYYKVVGDDTHADSEVFGPVTVTIGKATITPTVNITGWTYGGEASTPSVTGNTGNGTVTYAYSTSENGTYTETKPTNAGTYYVKASVAETDNYSAAVSAPVSFTIAKKALTDAMLTLGTSAFVHDGNVKTPSYTVTDGEKTLTVGTDYTVDSTSVTSASEYGTYTIKVNGAGNYTGSVSNAWNITDETNPSAEISIEDSKFKTFLNTITFGLFFNKTETVSITATDLGSGVSKIEYVVTDTAVASIDELNDLEGWTSVEGATASFVKEPDDKFIVYAKVTDKAGNVTYVSSDGKYLIVQHLL